MNSTVIRAAAAIVLAVTVAGCGGGDGTEGPDLSAPPTNVTWSGFQGVRLPHTDQGPKQDADGAATGFEHSPPGAGVAAVTHQLRLSLASDAQWPHVVNRELVPGPERDEVAINRVRLSVTGSADPELAPRLLGYRITDYREDASTVDVYTEYPDSSRAVTHTTVEWFAEDWRLRLPRADSTERPVDPIYDLPADIVTLEAPT